MSYEELSHLCSFAWSSSSAMNAFVCMWILGLLSQSLNVSSFLLFFFFSWFICSCPSEIATHLCFHCTFFILFYINHSSLILYNKCIQCPDVCLRREVGEVGWLHPGCWYKQQMKGKKSLGFLYSSCAPCRGRTDAVTQLYFIYSPIIGIRLNTNNYSTMNGFPFRWWCSISLHQGLCHDHFCIHGAEYSPWHRTGTQ